MVDICFSSFFCTPLRSLWSNLTPWVIVMIITQRAMFIISSDNTSLSGCNSRRGVMSGCLEGSGLKQAVDWQWKEGSGGWRHRLTYTRDMHTQLPTVSVSLSNVLLSHSNRWKQALVPEQNKDLELEVAGGPPEKAVINHCWTPEMEGCSWFMILRKAFIKIIVVKQSSQANLPECVVRLRLYTCIIRPRSYKSQIFVCKNVGTLC